MRFSDYAYVEAYMRRGEYPRIHDDIFALDEGLPRLPVVDVGACWGLLSARLAAAGHAVSAIEPCKAFLRRAVRAKGVTWHGFGITPATVGGVFPTVLKDAGVRIAFCRRVVPEIYDTGGVALVNRFGLAMRDAGVETVAIEGRKPCARAVNGLPTLDDEIAALQCFKEVRRAGNCALLAAV